MLTRSKRLREEKKAEEKETEYLVEAILQREVIKY